MLTRRDFINGTIGAMAWSGLAARAAAADDNGGLQLGLATYQWGMDWDIPTLIANLSKARIYGVELRTQSKYAHGVEIGLTAGERAEVRKRFADSPVRVVCLACSERLDWPEAAKLKAAVEAAKGYLQLSHDVGATSLRVFPNQFHPDVPKEQTIAQIAAAVNELGAHAAGLGQRVDLEAHGPAGELATMQAIMGQVTHPAVGVRLNCDKRDAQGDGLAANFAKVKGRLARTVHLHNLASKEFPYALQLELLAKAGWTGWMLMENSDKVPDRVQALIEQRDIWTSLVDKARKAAAP